MTRPVAGQTDNLDLGTPGAGARRQHERRRAAREAATREAHPHIGGLLLRLGEPPAHERAWRTGAIGEDAVAEHLAANCPRAVVLHDRPMPGSRANIDHIAIAPTGVLVIDAKRYRGKIEVRKPLFGDEKLVVSGRDKTKLVEGLRRQVDAVRAALALIEQQVPVGGCFCFLNPDGQAGGSGIPLLRTLSVDGFALYYPRRLSKRLNRDGPVSPEQIAVLAEALVELFPAA
jgi:Nuclease-related domain